MTDRCNPMESKSAVEVAEGLAVPEFKAAKDGTVEGYGAIFGNIDRGHDIVEAGAFAESLNGGAKIKMLWQHDPYNPIGVWEEVKEDDKGLWVKGRILGDVERGREASALVKAGAIDGLSIGYRTLEFREAKVDDRWVRVIEKAELWEVSLVTFPMNPEATIDAVKAAAMSQREFERQLLRDSKMSRSVVSALMRDGFKGVQALSDSGDEDFSELLEAVQADSLMNSLS
ncbi:HK97 family phage prohead protease [Pacificoceanicola onchidii]|uniref:HK97 family phage prohead protease n=1 Tax=Pacificoceanicola onchidii TaxID=2562685 RepID=UPI003B82D3AF